MCNAANAEGQQLDEFPALPTAVTHEQQSPIDITYAANQLVEAQAAAYNAKLRVFRTFCSYFNEAAKEFTTGPERDFAKHFSSSFLEFWNQALANTNCASTPTYSSIAAKRTTSPTRLTTTNTANPQHKPAATYHQAQRSPVPAPPREDLRVFVRLEADAPSRNHIGYAIRAHVASKTGLELKRIPQVLQVNSGWAIRAADKVTRDLLVERQAEWADDFGATAIETSQKWYNYVVDNCPRRLTDLYGNEVDYDAAVRDEVHNQTGYTPVSVRVPRRDNEQLPYKTLIISLLEPTKRSWSLFGTSRVARHIERPNPPKQCENCWDYHTRHACNRQTRCKRCGKTNHASDSCTAPEQCANCLGPHVADLAACPARPKRVHGLLHRLPGEQRAVIRQMGSRLFQQHQAAQQRQQSQTESNDQPASEVVTEQQRAPVAVMEPAQEHVNPQALTNFFTCTLPVLPSSSPVRLRAADLGPEMSPRRPRLTSPKRRIANTNPSSP
ncbi:hypothetical protein HIM_03026 [Hirsutella minnesotensis 3608]|nr:hypothetical protein HIM_03026 [Hirsutella minnesotensis 3608]